MLIINFLNFIYTLIQGTSFDAAGAIADFLPTFNSICSMIGLVLPMGTIKAILLITLGLYVVRIVISVWKLVLQLIPFV